MLHRGRFRSLAHGADRRVFRPISKLSLACVESHVGAGFKPALTNSNMQAAAPASIYAAAGLDYARERGVKSKLSLSPVWGQRRVAVVETWAPLGSVVLVGEIETVSFLGALGNGGRWWWECRRRRGHLASVGEACLAPTRIFPFLPGRGLRGCS